jgi:hypothetical protein
LGTTRAEEKARNLADNKKKKESNTSIRRNSKGITGALCCAFRSAVNLAVNFPEKNCLHIFEFVAESHQTSSQ